MKKTIQVLIVGIGVLLTVSMHEPGDSALRTIVYFACMQATSMVLFWSGASLVQKYRPNKYAGAIARISLWPNWAVIAWALLGTLAMTTAEYWSVQPALQNAFNAVCVLFGITAFAKRTVWRESGYTGLDAALHWGPEKQMVYSIIYNTSWVILAWSWTKMALLQMASITLGVPEMYMDKAAFAFCSTAVFLSWAPPFWTFLRQIWEHQLDPDYPKYPAERPLTQIESIRWDLGEIPDWVKPARHAS